jgi:quercetin dioxygenase-like cupin family protein
MKAVFREPGAGERIPSTGATHTIVLPGESTGGVFAADVIDMPPGWAAVAAHTHLSHEETFYVLDGVVTYTLDGETVVGEKGSTLYVPRGVRHGFGNRQAEPARVLNLFTPAGYEKFFPLLAEVFDAAEGKPSREALAKVFGRFDTVL